MAACTMGPSLLNVTRWNSHLSASIARAASAGLRSEGMPKAWRRSEGEGGDGVRGEGEGARARLSVGLSAVVYNPGEGKASWAAGLKY